MVAIELESVSAFERLTCLRLALVLNECNSRLGSNHPRLLVPEQRSNAEDSSLSAQAAASQCNQSKCIPWELPEEHGQLGFRGVFRKALHEQDLVWRCAGVSSVSSVGSRRGFLAFATLSFLVALAIFLHALLAELATVLRNVGAVAQRNGV